MRPDIEELKRLLAEATPGPWVHEIDGANSMVVVKRPDLGLGDIIVFGEVMAPFQSNKEDGDLACALRYAAPWMLARIEKLERVREAAKAVYREISMGDRGSLIAAGSVLGIALDAAEEE